MKIQELIQLLDEWAPPSYAEDFDNVGLLVGNNKNECTGILITLDTTEEIIEEAIAKKCNVILSFHPIIFSGLKKLTGRTYVEKVVLKAIENKISIIALHTRLDNHPKGMNNVIAKRLELTNTEVLIQKKETLKKLVAYVPENHVENVLESLHQAGAGNLDNYSECSFQLEGTGKFKGSNKSNPFNGNKLEKVTVKEIQINVVFESHLLSNIQKSLVESHPYETVAYEIYSLINSYSKIGMGCLGDLKKQMDSLSFLKFVKKQMKTEVIRYSKISNKKIRKVAVLGGSGSFAIEDVKRKGADAFVTSDLKYHQFFQAENQLLLVDIGHYESEKFIKNYIYNYLTKKIPNFEIVLSNIITNPVNYL